MKLYRLENQNSLLNVFIAEIRDTTIQRDSLRFRRNLERIGEIIAYEISKKLSFLPKQILTPLARKEVALIENEVVVCSILRAGLTMHQGVMNYFDRAESAFVSAYRTTENKNLEVVVNYSAAPSLEGKTVILVDPMIATGTTLQNVLQALSPYGNPKELHVASAIGSQKGVENVLKNFPENSCLWIAAIDTTLNNKNYIVPGLGDAGDLAFGKKIKIKKVKQ